MSQALAYFRYRNEIKTLPFRRGQQGAKLLPKQKQMSNENPKWPYRIPETEAEIKAAIGWLKETGQIPVNGRIKNGPGPMPLDRLGLPMEEVKDLMALHGAGSFGRQVGVQVRKEAAGCVTGLINLVLVGVGIALFILFVGAMVGLSHNSNPTYYQSSVSSTPTPEVTAAPGPDYAPRAELVHLPRNRGEWKGKPNLRDKEM